MLAGGRGGTHLWGPRSQQLRGQGASGETFVWGLAWTSLGSPPSRCEGRQGAVQIPGAPAQTPSSSSRLPCGVALARGPRRGLLGHDGAMPSPRPGGGSGPLREGSAGAGWSQPHVFAFQASWPLRSLDLGLAPVPAFSQPEAHRAPVLGSRQLGESGCSAPPVARRQKRALCVGTCGPVPLGAHRVAASLP